MNTKSGKLLYKICGVLLCIILIFNCVGCVAILDKIISIDVFFTDLFHPSQRSKLVSFIIENHTDNDVVVELPERVKIPDLRNSFKIPSCSRFQATNVTVPLIEQGALYTITSAINEITVSERRSHYYHNNLNPNTELIIVDIESNNNQSSCSFSEPHFVLILDNGIYNTGIDVYDPDNRDARLFIDKGGNVVIGRTQGYITEAYRYQATKHVENTQTTASCVCSYLLYDHITSSFDSTPEIHLIFYECSKYFCPAKTTK